MFACFSGFSQNDYYYYQGEKIYLTPSYQYVNIVTANSFDETQLTSSNVQPFTLRTENIIRNGEYKKNAKLEFSTIPTNQISYDQKIVELKSLNNIESVYPYYIYNGHPFGASNKILVKLKQPSDTTLLQSIATQKSFDVLYQMSFMPLWYIVSCNENTVENPVNLAAFIYETGYFDEADPSFTGRFITPTYEDTTPTSQPVSLDLCENYSYNEPVAPNQWNFFNNSDPNGNPLADINVCGAWEAGYFGQGVTVAIIDNGVQDNITDLPVTINDIIDRAGAMDFDFYYDTINDQHGTNVAGVIGAKHDANNPPPTGNMGGIAPQSTLKYVVMEMGINFSEEDAVEGIEWAILQGAKVINMSIENGTNAPSSNFAEALTIAANNNIVLVAGAGNFGYSGMSNPANHPDVMAVGGSTVLGERWSGTHYGPELDVLAPAEDIYTNAFNNGIWEGFGATSCATPHVSGIAALMFSASPDIKNEAIRNIIRRTAQKSIDLDYPYNEINFALGSRNDYMGYGIPEATACVLTAQEFETGTLNGESILDLHVRNSVRDYGKEPDNVTKHASNVLWESPDIWVPAGTGELFFSDIGTIDYSQGTVNVIVRVINKSNKTLLPGEAKVKLYWSKLGGATGSWPSYWNGDETFTNCDGNEIAYGGIIGNPNGENTGKIKPGAHGLVFFTWQVPNPADYCYIFGNVNDDPNREAFSFLARIISEDDPMVAEEVYGDTNGDGIDDIGNVWINTKNNNNIAWKNVEVVKQEPNPRPSSIIISNLSNQTEEYSLEFKLEDNIKGTAIFEEAEVIVQMDTNLYQDWTTKGAVRTNFIAVNQQFKVTEDDALIDNISLQPGEVKVLQISFNFLADALTDKQEFVYHFIQRDKVSQDIISGKTFHIIKGETVPFDADAGDDKEIDKNDSITLSAESINEPATYNWYNPEGALIYTGQDFTLSPELTREYTLEIIKDADGLKDYDTVTIEVNPYVFGIMSPNPATNEITINYIAEDASSAYIMFTEQITGNTYNHILDTQAAQKTIAITTYPTGIYVVSLICDGTLIESKQLIIN